MLVGMWMTREIVTVQPSDSLAHAAQVMALRKFRHLPVLDAQGHLAGIVSATDVFHAVPLRLNPFSAAGVDSPSLGSVASLRVADVMSTGLATTTTGAPIESAAAIMHDRKIGALPVVHSGELVGLITQSDILRAFTEILSQHGAGARITFDIANDEDMVPLLAALTARHKLRLTSLISLRSHGRCYCVVRISGTAIDALLDELWKSGHRVESVIRG